MRNRSRTSLRQSSDEHICTTLTGKLLTHISSHLNYIVCYDDCFVRPHLIDASNFAIEPTFDLIALCVRQQAVDCKLAVVAPVEAQGCASARIEIDVIVAEIARAFVCRAVNTDYAVAPYARQVAGYVV